MPVFINVLILVWIVWSICYLYFKWKFSYWKRKKVPYLHPRIPFGTPDNPVSTKVHPSFAILSFYDQLKNQSQKHGGLYWFTQPIYMVVDPNYLKNILVKDFQYFSDRGRYFNKKDDPLSCHLFNINGADWYNIRSNLTPTFTSGKIKMMFKIIEHCANQLKDAINKNCLNNEPIDTKTLLECYTTDVIGSCAFGLDCDSFKNPTNEFKKNCLKFITAKPSMVKTLLINCYPQLARLLKIRFVSPLIRKFFLDTVIDTISYRRKNDVKRNDFLNLLMELEKSEDNENGLDITEIAAQAFVFFIAGFETSSAAMAFCLYELACNEDVQNKLRDEITEILKKHGNNINYEAITEMKYLGQVVDETIRKYPTLPIITRKCVQDYKLPDADVIIEKGTSIIIPCYALHHDPEYYPDPKIFDPERFNAENKNKIPSFAYLPFGAGPRNCIGMRFGLLQVKVGLITVLRQFKFSPSAKTIIPFEYRRQGFFLSNVNTVWLNVEKAE